MRIKLRDALHHSAIAVSCKFQLCYARLPCIDQLIRLLQVSASIHNGGGWLKTHELAALDAVACSPERTFMLDIGSNLGAFSVIAAAKGCKVVLVDPM